MHREAGQWHNHMGDEAEETAPHPVRIPQQGCGKPEEQMTSWAALEELVEKLG